MYLDQSSILGIVIAAVLIGVIWHFFFRNKSKSNAGEIQRRVAILENEFPYYNKLPEKSKKIFIKKLNEFYQSKFFIAKRGFELDERKKVIICASAAQLTFGLPTIKLTHFESIMIFDKRSHIRGLEQFTYADDHREGGRMYFSWEEIQHGLDNPTDGYNATLHKLAEALLYEDQKPNEEFNFLDQEQVKLLEELYHDKKRHLRSENHPFLNSTAAKTFEDFFAVAVENYFERPYLVKEHMPNLYKILCKLLNQDTVELEEMNKKTEVSN